MNEFVLKKLRKDKHLTQTKLAEILNVDPSLISKWESSGSVPNTDALLRLCDVLECSMDYLLTGKESSYRKGFEDYLSLENIDAMDAELLRVSKNLSIRSKNKLLTYAYDLEDKK